MKYVVALFLTVIPSIVFADGYGYSGYGYSYEAAYPAASEWKYLHYKSGYYVKTNGFQNDGYYYTKDHCGRWVRGQAIADVAPDINSPTFERDVLKFVEKRETRASRAAILEKLGIYPQQGGYGGGGLVGQSVSGFSYIRQGGSSVSALTGFNGYPVIDPRPLISEQQRLLSQSQAYNAQATAGTSELVSQYTDIAKIQAAAAAYSQGYAAAIQSAHTPKEEYHQYKSEPKQVCPPEKSEARPTDQSAVQDQERQSLINMIGDRLHKQDCLQCHSPGSKENAPNLEAPRSGKDLEEFKALVEKRLRLPVNDPKHMPKGGRQYSEEEIAAYVGSI